jgi:hypothetical protein
MKVMSISISGYLFIVMNGIFDASGVFAAYGSYGSIVNARVVNQTGEISIEEALLNFRIEEIVGTSPSSCAAERKLEREQRLLDPQLSASGKRSNADPASSVICKETESALRMNP